MRLLTGIKPTGQLHLGNYVGAMRPVFMLLDGPETEAFLFIADGHAMTTVHDGETLRQQTMEVTAAWMAMGLDVARVTFYRQSRVPEVFELFWMLSCLCPKGLMNRAHAYKAVVQPLIEKGAKDVDQDVSMGLFNYPVLMAADILLFGASAVPVGIDQVQHVEIARDLALKMNQVYGDILTVPKASVQEEQPSLLGLDGRKMSKSYNNVIPLFADEETLRKLIFKIKTNSQAPEEPKDPKECLLFALYKAFSSATDVKKMTERYAQGISWGEMKDLTFQAVNREIAPLRDSYAGWLRSPARLEEALEIGEARARKQAFALMMRLRNLVGF